MTVRSNINTASYWDDVYRTEAERGWIDAEDYHRDYPPIHDAIIRLIPDRSRVLDLACGPGILCRKIRRARGSAAVVGVDFSRWVIDRNRDADRGSGIEYLTLDIRNGLDDVPGRFDVVVMCEILEHLDEPGRVVAGAMERLRPGGRFILTCPHDEEVPDPEHVGAWGHDEVFHLLAPYGREVSFVHFPPPYYHPWLLAHLVRITESGTETP